MSALEGWPVIIIVVGIVFGFIVACVYAFVLFPHKLGMPFYWVHHGEGAVLYPFGTKEKVDLIPGIKPKHIFTYVDKFRINNDYLVYPNPNDEMIVYTQPVGKNDKLYVQYLVPFKRDNLLIWATENVASYEQFKLGVLSVVKNSIKSQKFDDVIYNSIDIEKLVDTNLKESGLEEQFGIKFYKSRMITVNKEKEDGTPPKKD